MKFIILFLVSLMLINCSTPNNLKFVQFELGEKFNLQNELSLGINMERTIDLIVRDLKQEKEFSKVPNDIICGIRQASNSYYQVKNKKGQILAQAESSISKDLSYMIDRVEIQVDESSGKILITEDTTDALPAKRYILFSPIPGGYSVYYLSPLVKTDYNGSNFHNSMPKIRLLGNEKVDIEGKSLLLKKLPKSALPFSVGG